MFLHQMIGQKHIVSNLLPQLIKSSLYKKPIEHILFYGQPGLGKTTFAEAIAAETFTIDFIQKTGQELTIDGIKNILSKIWYQGILFIDEIHRMRAPVAEIMYGPLQIINNLQKDFIKNRKFPEKYIWESIQMNPFTLIGATTSSGMLMKPLRDRFVHTFEFKPYTIEELCTILENNGCPKNCAKLIAQRSRGVPRIAMNLLINIHNQGFYVEKITPEHCHKVFKSLGIDKNGLNESDVKILKYLNNNGESGEQTLSFALEIDKEDLVFVNEPHLIKMGLIKRTPRGRVITSAGKDYL